MELYNLYSFAEDDDLDTDAFNGLFDSLSPGRAATTSPETDGK